MFDNTDGHVCPYYNTYALRRYVPMKCEKYSLKSQILGEK